MSIRGHVAVQCANSAGETGTFLFNYNAAGARYMLSPLFDSLAGLYPWLDQNGWTEVRDGTQVPTGTYAKD